MTDTRLAVQNQASFLAGSGCIAGATTIVLQAFTRIDGTVLTMANFGSKGFMTLEPNNSTQEEQISFTGITQNANGTATLTGVSTVLTVSPYTETSGTASSHPGGSVAIVTNTAQWYNQFTAKANDEAVTGMWTVPTPLADFNPATKKYVDDLVNGGTVTNVAVIVSATAGETIASGNLVYFDETQNEWMKCDADTAATVLSVHLGIAQGSGTNGNPITGGVLLIGTDSTGSGMTQGDLLYASNTAGGISNSAGTVPRVVGIATSATSRYFNPYFQQELTRYAVDAVGTDAYAVTLPGAFNAYYPGMMVTFKAATANTGAATLAVNGLTAKSITKQGATALATGDISANQICVVIYDGTQFQLVTGRPPTTVTYASGTTTKNIADVDATQTIPHGLSGTPQRVRVTAQLAASDHISYSEAILTNGVTTSNSMFMDASASSGTMAVLFRVHSTSTDYNTGTITVDGTNISIAWNDSNSPSGVANILWEAALVV